MLPPSTTPFELGYRWPAEWGPHTATWLAWPHNPDTWPGKLAAAIAEFVEFAKTLASYERIHVLAGSPTVMREAEKQLGHIDAVTLWDIPTNDAWIRDYGPMFVVDGNRSAIVDWRYNAWGNRYPPYDEDEASVSRIYSRLGTPRFSVPMVLEGGSVEGNGHGSLMTTRTCLLNENRNPNLTQQTIEDYLRRYLSIDHVIWLDAEIAGDDTDGHIDQLARFVDVNVVVVATETNRSDVNFMPLSLLCQQLRSEVLPNVGQLHVVELPMPEPVYHHSRRLPASYTNFYIANNIVLVPQFGDKHDARACDVLRELFPHREVVGLACRELALGLGGFHCLTQQQPSVSAKG